MPELMWQKNTPDKTGLWLWRTRDDLGEIEGVGLMRVDMTAQTVTGLSWIPTTTWPFSVWFADDYKKLEEFLYIGDV